MPRALGVAAAVAALGALAAPAAADESLQATGSITYTWRGDPARGCAAQGLCGIQGALILGVQGGADAITFGRTTNINVFPAPATVRVRNTESGAGAECVDVPPNGGAGNLLIGHQAGGALTALIEPPVSSGRCPGPLAQDLAGLRLPVRKTAGRLPSFDLRGSQPFVAGPFSGTLVSTLVFTPSPNGGASSTSSGPGQTPPDRRRKVLIERVSLRYHVATLPGGLGTSFAGEPDPFCAALDACGAMGTLSLSPAPLRGTLTLTASRMVGHRRSARQAIADFRAGRLGRPFGVIFASEGTSVVTETYTGGDGVRCQDSSSRRLRPLLFVGGPGGGGGVGLTLNEPTGPDGLLRTHCPGPSDVDVLGNMGVLARGSISRVDLLRRSTEVALSNPGGFSAVGYAGSRSGEIELSLALEHVRSGTVQEERP